MGVWSMLWENKIDFETYLKIASTIAPVVDQLASVTKVIWLNQYPVVEFYGKTDSHNTHIYTEKINQYNVILRRVFR